MGRLGINGSSYLPENLRRLRKAKGLTQSELAGAAGLPRATLASLEHGASNPGLDSVLAVASALNVTLDELVLAPPGERVFKVGPEQAKEYRDDDGRYVARLLSPIASRGVQIQHVAMRPRCSTAGRPHPRGSQEFFIAYMGTATVTVADVPYGVEAGALLQFPGHLEHRYENASDAENLEAFSIVIFATT